MPPDETGPVPVAYAQIEPRYYGITPASLVVVLAAIALGSATFLFASGHWPIGLMLLGLALLFTLVAIEAMRRRGSNVAFSRVRERASGAADSLAVRGRAAGRVVAARRELQRIASSRARLLFELGEAVYRGDEQTTETARARIQELDELARRREAEMQAVLADAQARVARRRLEVQPTEMVEVPDDPSPGPVRIPEPYPPPDEGSPPQPAIIPEPGPLPDQEPEESKGAKRR